jgi:SAM-dependent methyltransferase
MQVPLVRRPFYQRDLAARERDELALQLSRCGAPEPEPRPKVVADIRVELRSLNEWQSFVAKNPQVTDKKESDRIVAHGAACGVRSSFFGQIPPKEIVLRGENYREQFLARGFNPRQRALLDLLQEAVGNRTIYDVSIYAHEGLTAVALALRGRYPRFLGSEYAANETERRRIFPVPGIDITASGLPEKSFDVVLSGDVFEHVPDLDAALRDTARILVPGGCLVASFPFAYFHEQTAVKARLSNGKLEHLAPPEYHGNPMDPENGSLVFQIPGWAILSTVRDAGFSRAHMLFWSSTQRGFTGGGDLTGLFLLVATR